MKELLFYKLKSICSSTILWTIGIQIVSLFLKIGTLGEMGIVSCDYHIL